MKQGLFVIVFGLFAPGIFGQQVLTLQHCLDLVESHSRKLATESAKLNAARVNRQFHWWGLLPDLSANVGLNTSFGRRLDPFTNTFATNSVNSHAFGLNSGMRVFNGFDYFYKRNVWDKTIQLNEISLEEKVNELQVNVVETYLNLCKLTVQIKLTGSRIEKYREIQKIQRLLLHEGKITVIDTLKSHNSLLQEQDLLSGLRYELKLETMELNFQTGLPLASTHELVLPSVSGDLVKLHFSEMYLRETLRIETGIRGEQLQSERAKVLPSVSLNALVGTGFSTNNKNYLLPGNPTKSYPSQLSENLYEGIGVYITIPLFNRGEWLKTKQLNELQKQEMELQQQEADLSLEKKKLELVQKRLNNRAKQEQSKQQASNLEIMYAKSVLLYQEGRLTYPEIETTLMEWQMLLLACELLKMDGEILKLYE